jgi:site-specific DNA-methyltransferase (adenine-specific)
MRNELGACALYLGDCLAVLPDLPDHSIHCVLADLPYGTSACPWDSVIPLDALWAQYKRLIVGSGALIFTASQPFTTALIASNLPWFRHHWIWDKQNASNFANAKKAPLKCHEDVVVFAAGQPPYYPIKTQGKPNHRQGASTTNASETRHISGRVGDDLSGLKYPKSILNFPKHSSQCRLHPTQKPVELLAYLIETYTLPGQIVLDNTMGSGSTAVACLTTGRRFVGIEKEPKYFEVACDRIRQECEATGRMVA